MSLIISLIFGSLIVAFDPISKGRLISQTIHNLKGESSQIKKNILLVNTMKNILLEHGKFLLIIKYLDRV